MIVYHKTVIESTLGAKIIGFCWDFAKSGLVFPREIWYNTLRIQQESSLLCGCFRLKSKRQMIHTFTPSNQRATIGTGGDENETFTSGMERNSKGI